MRTPDFLVVGAARSGTTSLHSYLRQHPGLFIPGVKEPCFFIFEDAEDIYVKGKFAFAVRSLEAYEKLFRNAGKQQLIGEMSTPYLYLHDRTIAGIRKHFVDYANVKIVILLRNPVERAFSQYKWRLRDGYETLSFEEAIGAERERMSHHFSFDYFYVDRGFYFGQVKSYLENFNHVKIILFEDFINDPFLVLKDLSRFLGISDFNFKLEKEHNKSASPRFRILSRMAASESRIKFKLWYLLPDSLRKRIRDSFTQWNEAKGIDMEMKDETRRHLTEVYREDINALQSLIGRDLSAWLR